MDKILTVSIAAYNVADYIEDTLESCIIDDMDSIEVLIVDDGATDNTPELAQKFVEKYPDTFKLIRKENGGYGTTINSGVEHATGKYFKLLDGDDYFDTDSLKKFIIRLKAETSDMVLTKNLEISNENGEEALPERGWYKYLESKMDISEMDSSILISMWNAAVKTELIKNNPYTYPKRYLYTDSLFVVNALARSKTIAFYDLELYKYRVDRIGQSTSSESLLKHCEDMYQVYLRVNEVYKKALSESNINKEILATHLAMTYLNYVSAGFMLNKKSADNKKRLIELEKECKKSQPEVYKLAAQMSKRVSLMRLTCYLSYYLN
ncbi:MAG: glycosyltransferase family 2 protein [Pseudobutyrivibrio sp.]|nr:glycosyltransferase family 2 protein [Pseudobutyrivibrio sp.]